MAFTGASPSITPATLTVTAEAKSKEYGAADPPLTYVSSGYKFTDSAASVLSGSLERAQERQSLADLCHQPGQSRSERELRADLRRRELLHHGAANPGDSRRQDEGLRRGGPGR